MFSKLAQFASEQAFSILAFSLFGLLFAMRPMTWLPTVIILLSTTACLLNPLLRLELGRIAKTPEIRPIFTSFVSWFAICLSLSVFHLGFSRHSIPENELRIFLALSTFVLAVRSTSKRAFMIGMLVGSVCVVFDVLFGYAVHDEYFPRISGTTNHPIHFGNFAAILAMLLASAAVLAVSTSIRFRLLCLVGVCLAFGSAIASQSRSSFLVVVCLVPLALMGLADRFHRWVVRIALAFVIAGALVVATKPNFQEALRLHDAAADIELIEANNYQGSIGSRLSMWYTALEIFKEYPFAGIGPNKFQAEFSRRMQTGESPVADAAHNQPHNDLLNAAASGGLLKLFAYLFLIVAPFKFFYNQYQANKTDLDRRMIPIMGMQVVGAFFLTGLTNSNFDLQIYSTMYAVLVCVLAKLSLYETRAEIITGNTLKV